MTNLPKHFNLMIFCVILCIIATATSSSSSSFSSSISSQSNRIRHQQHHQQLHHHRRRNVPRTYGIISQKVDGPVDVCTKKEVEKIYYPSFLLSLSTGNLDDLSGPSSARTCHFAVLRAPASYDTFVEISFSKMPDKEERKCFSIEGVGLTTLQEPDCQTLVQDKVFFREKADGKDLMISMAEANLRKNLNFQLMIQHLPERVEPETLNIIGDLRLKCDHPNELLNPFLVKDGADLTKKLEEPEKRVYTAKYDLQANVQGRYTCSWDAQRSEHSVYLVNVYAPALNCSLMIDGKETKPDGTKIGDYLEIYRDSESILGRLEFACVLGKATMDGVPDGELGWEASNGVDLRRDVRNEARRNEIKALFNKDVRQDFIQNATLKDVTYTCSVDHSKASIDFRGGEPKACSIKIIINDEPSANSASVTYIAIGVVVAGVIVIVVVFVLFWRRRKRHHDTTAGSVTPPAKGKRKKGAENPGVELT